ncbi:transposase family protein [Nostoc sp. CHAB 5715]|uniref:transposase family protein n=1 Tax=Nostoc sp. CHAB 5715 TaxID=2780400 RepID=UPI001E55810F|nr:transposase family protein [Nostoc sp. CHAB 5715]MCC5625450.1 transposase family protein [Nostoc sp. CHAB 5715]
MSVLTHLLPDSNNLKLENCQLDEIKTKIWLIVSAISKVVNCPVCNQATHKIHSRYERFLADLPWADYSITLQLKVRKFFCINTLCKRRIFTERRERSDQGFSLLNPYQDYLLSRWNSGNYNTQELFEEIRQAGYIGSYATVSRFTRYLKSLPGFEPCRGSRKNAFPRVSSSSHRPLTPSRVTALGSLRELDTQLIIAREVDLMVAITKLGCDALMGLRQKVARKNNQMYIKKDFDIGLLSKKGRGQEAEGRREF